MNEIAPQLRSGPKVLPTTQVCDGVPRLRWSLADFEWLIEAGILTEEDRVELIQGELVPMASKGNRHELVRDEIQNWMMDHKPADVRLSSEIGWRPPDADTYVEPDILISPRRFKGANVPPQEVLLAIEVADSSLRYDTTRGSAPFWVFASIGWWTRNRR